MNSSSEKKNNLEQIVSLAKRRGFIFQSSELYGGINGFWDYGPLGSELKRNVREVWWRYIVHGREDIVGLDAAIIMNPKIWEASGHLGGFSDPMVDCKICKKRYRADQLCEEQGSQLIGDGKRWKMPENVSCSNCGSKDLTEPRSFNLMFKTFVGPVEDDSAVAYLRPETAQAIFAQFLNILPTSRKSVPFGVAQSGKSFRNEINPRNFTFRSREFEQMEIEFFIRPDEAVELICGKVTTLADNPDLEGEPQDDWGWEVWHRYWVEQRFAWFRTIGLPADSLVERVHSKNELAHYAKTCVDIEYAFPFGIQELEGIAARGNFDLTQHQKFSSRSMAVMDDKLRIAVSEMNDAAKEAFRQKTVANWVQDGKSEEEATAFCNLLFEGRYIPHVVEPSLGTDRLVLALICNAFDEEEITDAKGKKEVRTVLRFHPSVAPVKVAVFPLVKNRPELYDKARDVFKKLNRYWNCFWDESGAIGRRYRRQDEIGTPFCITVDFDTLEDDTVTVRMRDSMEQTRVPVSDLRDFLEEAMEL
ncbi:MAG: glycine--tRNA ligase [Lentisphaerae bacterium]|jgi:glycyl-tRNA synthetase|nr:glycine--tRNA ligase [Lentisphaerota bacterium]